MTRWQIQVRNVTTWHNHGSPFAFRSVADGHALELATRLAKPIDHVRVVPVTEHEDEYHRQLLRWRDEHHRRFLAAIERGDVDDAEDEQRMLRGVAAELRDDREYGIPTRRPA